MKRKLMLIVLTITFMLTSSYTFAQNINLGNLQEGNTNILKVNTSINVELKENPTTGYTWHVIIQNEDIIKCVSDGYKEDKHEEGMRGVGGTHIWEFKTIKEGTSKIKFELYRSWEKDKIVETREYIVNVENLPKRDIKVFLNGKKIQMDVKPIVESGITLVPLRFLVESFGYSVNWDENNQGINIKSN